jgi:mannose-6-phosphate isomerase-like protein (cupin superfamily)
VPVFSGGLQDRIRHARLAGHLLPQDPLDRVDRRDAERCRQRLSARERAAAPYPCRCREAFVGLTGRCEFWLAGKTFARGPGEAACIPRGQQHTFRVIGEGESRHLVIPTPGGFEDFFAERAKGGHRIPEEMGAVVAIAARYRLTSTGPPLGA